MRQKPPRAGQQRELVIDGHGDHVLPADFIGIELVGIGRQPVGLQRRLLVLVVEADLTSVFFSGVSQFVVQARPDRPVAAGGGASVA